MYDLILFGVAIGFISGFFGIGGGMVLVPTLLFYGFVMKEAIAISIMQMIFSSIFGTFLNTKQKSKEIISDGLLLGIGGFLGGLGSGTIISILSNETLQYIFIAILLFSLIKLFTAPIQNERVAKSPNKIFLVLIGAIIGLLAMSIGIGGSIMITPLLVIFMRYELKHATALGLFFVIFSSIAGFISLYFNGHILFEEGLTVGLASLIGVYFGIKVKNLTHIKSYKTYILILYAVTTLFMIYKTFFD